MHPLNLGPAPAKTAFFLTSSVRTEYRLRRSAARDPEPALEEGRTAPSNSVRKRAEAYQKRCYLETTAVFAGLITIVFIGLIVKNVLFRAVEERTIRRWGMTH
jgi:hypothetical protein